MEKEMKLKIINEGNLFNDETLSDKITEAEADGYSIIGCSTYSVGFIGLYRFHCIFMRKD